MIKHNILLTIISKSATPKIFGELVGGQSEAIINKFTNAGKRPSGYDQSVVLDTLINLKTLDAWLACSCVSDANDDAEIDFKNAPLLIPAKIPSASDHGITLRRAPKRPDHHESCPFYRATNKAKESSPDCISNDNSDNQSKINSDECLAILKPVTFVASAMDSADDLRLGAQELNQARQTKLSRILLTVMDDAGLTRVAENYKSTKFEQFEALYNALSDYHFDGERKISVQKFTELSLEKLKRLCSNMRKSNDWKRLDVIPQGFLIGLASSIDGYTVKTINNNNVSIETPVILSGQSPKGPYLVIILVGSRNNGGFYECLRAFAQPVYSENLLVPVDSDYERQTLKILLESQSSKKYSIYKPVADREVSMRGHRQKTENTDILQRTPPIKVRPDFILTYQDFSSVVVETMGYRTDEYLERKKRTHAAMAKIGRIVEHRPECDADELLRKLI